jgi:hypothetical protein
MLLRRTLPAAAAACALVATAPAAAGGHVLSKSRAKAAAKSAAGRLARKRPGDASRPRYSTPRCKRRSRHRFVCTTTVRGTAACDRTEAACDGPSAWELSYWLTVKFRSTRSSRLSVTAVQI